MTRGRFGGGGGHVPLLPPLGSGTGRSADQRLAHCAIKSPFVWIKHSKKVQL